MSRATHTEIRKRRAYRLLTYPLLEALRIGAITKEEFKERHLEVIDIVSGDDKPRVHKSVPSSEVEQLRLDKKA